MHELDEVKKIKSLGDEDILMCEYTLLGNVLYLIDVILQMGTAPKLKEFTQSVLK